MNNIINIICYNYILKPEKEENERFKLKLHTISIKQIEKAQKKDETLLINKDHIIKLINKYLDMNYNFIYEHHYFKFAAAIFTYLHSLKLANDKLALRRLRYDDLEITKEEFYNEEYDIKKELKKKLLKKANGKEDEDEDPLKELSDNEEEEDGKLQSVSSRKKKIDKDTGSGIYFFSNIQKDVTFYCKKYVTSTDDVDIVEDDNEDKDINKLSKDMRKRVKTYQPLINARDNIQVIEYCNAEDEKIKINKKNEEVDEFVLKKLYFLLNPNIIKVSDEKLSQFLIEADRDSGATKIREFINFYEAFVLEVKINDKFRKTNPTLFNFLSNLNFFWINLFSFIFATGLNFVQMGLLKANDLEVRFSQTYKIIVSLAIINIVYNIFFLICYTLQNQKFLNKLKIKEVEETLKYDDIKDSLTSSEKQNIIILNYFNDSDKAPFFVNILITTLSILFPHVLSFLLGLLLFMITYFSDTAMLIIRIFVSKIGDLVEMIILLIVLTYVLANFGFFFLNEDMSVQITGTDERENGCINLSRCFITFFNLGVRFGGGIGDGLQRYKFITNGNSTNYAARYVLEFIYFVVVNLLLLNMINGIIITPFGEEREKSEAKMNDVYNKCYICSLDKIFLARNKIDFNTHITGDHNFMSYLQFLDYLNTKDDIYLELEEIYIKDMIRDKNISCFPINKTLNEKGEMITSDK